MVPSHRFTSRSGNVYFISMLTPSLVLTMLSTHRSFTAFPRYRFLLILFAFCNPTNLDSVYNTPSHKLLSRYHHSRLFWHPGFEHRLIIIPFQVEWHIDAVVLKNSTPTFTTRHQVPAMDAEMKYSDNRNRNRDHHAHVHRSHHHAEDQKRQQLVDPSMTAPTCMVYTLSIGRFRGKGSNEVAPLTSLFRNLGLLCCTI